MPRWLYPFGNGQTPPPARLEPTHEETGVIFRLAPEMWQDPLAFPADAACLGFLHQAEEEGFAQFDEASQTLTFPWGEVYRLLECDEYAAVAKAFLDLPPQENWRPVLESRGGLADADFRILLAGWQGPDGLPYAGNAEVQGAILRLGARAVLLPKPAWETVAAVFAFRDRPHDRGANERGWADIRAKALAADAVLDHFLAHTVVLTPDKLQLSLRRGEGVNNRVVELIPGFDGAPPRWLEIFDQTPEVRTRYDVPDGAGLVHVLPSPEVRAVLAEIKRMPGRRVAGERAEAFIRNPYAVLGTEAAAVIDPESFEHAREEAGLGVTRFTARIEQDARGRVLAVGLDIQTMAGEDVHSEIYRFAGPDELERFLAKLDQRLASGAQYCHWQGFDFDILGDTAAQADLLRAALDAWRNPPPVDASEVLDLAQYSERVMGVGVQRAFYSPFIARLDENRGWFPENVGFALFYTPRDGETVAVQLDADALRDFRRAMEKAQEAGRPDFEFPGCPEPLPVEWARKSLDVFERAEEDIAANGGDPQRLQEKGLRRQRIGLLIKPNIERIDYEARRGRLTPPQDAEPRLPASLKNGVTLKTHQLRGVAWLQHLWSRSPAECRGALLADDMGLGKTLQLLCFMARIIEDEPNAEPFLVVAPVALLENWREEIDKFFEPRFKVLTLYGGALRERRARAINEALAEQGIVNLLHPGWRAGANLILTTYETLRDFEFSFARESWSAVICDEAQKIKNPNALVTRAAKKLKARFCIACTGTPVENSLTDLWCLFDFIQPGLLGALNDFGRRYRRPIEARDDTDRQRIEELRALIEPQTLRRTKAEVAQDLPQKHEYHHELSISPRQRQLYAQAVETFRRNPAAFNGPLGLLHYLRQLCTHPKLPGAIVMADAGHMDSPKLAWLLERLSEIQQRPESEIQQRGEKAIVFCEFRDIQRLLQSAIAKRFRFTPDIVNGETSAAAHHAHNRQRRIRAFQERPGFGVIILSPLAVGFGLNIQAANHVIHFTRTWNPAKEDQATDRAYRIGQTRDVHVHYPSIVAEDFVTFDARLHELLTWKRGLAADMLNGTGGDLRAADFGNLGAPGGQSVFDDDDVLTEADIVALAPAPFETFCALLWSKMGYTHVQRTPQVGDGGVDVVAIGGERGVLIQCKTAERPDAVLGWEAVRDVVAGAPAYRARFPGVSFSLAAVTNRQFNDRAVEQAELNMVELFDIRRLAELAGQYPVPRIELL